MKKKGNQKKKKKKSANCAEEQDIEFAFNSYHWSFLLYLLISCEYNQLFADFGRLNIICE